MPSLYAISTTKTFQHEEKEFACLITYHTDPILICLYRVYLSQTGEYAREQKTFNIYIIQNEQM